jgi:hypothetical protein
VRTVGRGFFPLDQRLRINRQGWSEQVEKQVVKLIAHNSYGEAIETYQELVGIRLPKTTAWEKAQKRGQQLCKIQMEKAEEAAALPKAQEIVPGTSLEAVNKGASMDGAFVYILGEEWKEVKIGCIFEYERHQKYCEQTKEMIEVAQASQVSYVAHLGGPEPLGQLLSAEADRRDYDRAQERVTLGDGARWIWGVSGEHFPTAQEIVDWYHAVDHLWAVAHLSFQDKVQRDRWVNKRKTELWLGQAEQIASTITTLAQQHPEQQADLEAEAGYFRNNHRRMQYQEFREEGYPIGSGTVESGCKQLVTMRMKGPGMRWSRSGAQAMLALRAAYLSDNWDDAWKLTFAA